MRIRLSINPEDLNNCLGAALERELAGISGLDSFRVSTRTGSIILRSSDGQALEAALRMLVFFDESTVDRSMENEKGQGGEPPPPGALTLLISRFLMPPILRPILTLWKALPFFSLGLSKLFKGRLSVEVLDAAAIGTSLLRRDFASASTIILLLGIGESLAYWTRKKSRQTLTEQLALTVDSVWIEEDGKEKLIPYAELCTGQLVVVRAGGAIPVDGYVRGGEALVNESSMSGEPLAVRRAAGSYVYAGTVIEEGQILVAVDAKGDATRIQSIVRFIDSSELLKAGIQSKAEHLADAIVPFSFGISLLAFLLTGSLLKASSALMVDYSCAIKLATPLTILAAIREGAGRGVLFKGGRFIEGMAEADTIVFDKTGTLTEARPSVTRVIPFAGRTENEVLCLAACLEEHFPHPVAHAVVFCAKERKLSHSEMHSQVNYISAHGISSTVEGEKVIIGSRHFVADDEQVDVSLALKAEEEAARNGASLLYLAVGGILSAVLCVSDPVRPEAANSLRALRSAGFSRLIMLTGDNRQSAAFAAERLGINDFEAQLLPHGKADYISGLKDGGHVVVMVGDGINDSPAMSLADVGVSMLDGADLARETADITLQNQGLQGLLLARELSVRVMRRIRTNFAVIVTGNSILLTLGLFGIFTPALSALAHNLLTVLVSANSVRSLLPRNKN
ncbi:MAG: heavy metal translocating P-type ATPase [Deltaproteobacteria bacterium]|jgi:Cu2+-exporting ATPase|nr:heavy metal translocating P-type ATPase [Deltaproteobacteria bacterium]